VRRRGRGPYRFLLPFAVVLLGVLAPLAVAQADSYVSISGSGSTWSANAVDQWRRDVEQYGMRINFAAYGSSAGRADFNQGTVEFAVSEIPYGLNDNGNVDGTNRPFAYMPIVAGGTSFMYNLKIGGKQVKDLRLSGDVLAKIFTGVISNWADPAIKADNPNLALPARKIVPVVRSDGSGTTAQFTNWMVHQYPDIWNAYCKRAGRSAPCTLTSTYPTVQGMGFISASGSVGVSQYTAQAQNEGTITYVEYSYPRELGFPVVKVKNAAGYYVLPTAQNVAVALLQARINEDKSSKQYLTSILDNVYTDPDPRAYPLSSYSYMILPVSTTPPMTTNKGRTLGAFGYYFLCQGQQRADDLGYSPLPINLVRAGLDQVRRVPGVNVQSIDISKCNNPTFSSDGSNTLAKTAPQPLACDKQGPVQCVGGAPAAGAGPGTTGIADPSSPNGPQQSASASANPGATSAPGGGTSGPPAPQIENSSGAPGSSGGPVDPDMNGSAVNAQNVAAASSIPVTLASDSSFGESKASVAIVVALLLALLVVPPMVGRYLRRRPE
jgi:phosphate ABC transporter phosphate-binding protein